ncbi:hypothetical protein [Halanaerobacter jeridensis]|uniref:Uncharacterized protein n=1 Tax=Halanaerobacter jeridensis TaxID=706427 RepID=A0A938XUS8_9FIRM|nr:hypothetical protein [Halanaerobacter jeridensis]MBM7557905.1 hypothetical protein [Halanaerobacter jeridensis]
MIEKKKIEIKFDDEDSWERISELVAKAFIRWQSSLKEKTKAELIDEFFVIPTITFILGTITTGFLKQIGEEIWSNLKKVVSESNICRPKPNMKLNFNYEGVQFIVEVEHNDLQTLHRVLKNLDDIIKGISKEEEQKVKFILGENGKFKRKF